MSMLVLPLSKRMARVRVKFCPGAAEPPLVHPALRYGLSRHLTSPPPTFYHGEMHGKKG